MMMAKSPEVGFLWDTQEPTDLTERQPVVARAGCRFGGATGRYERHQRQSGGYGTQRLAIA